MSDFQADFAFSDDLRAHPKAAVIEPERRLNAGQGLLLATGIGGFMWLAIGLTIRHYF